MPYEPGQLYLAEQKFQSVAAITPASLGEKAIAAGLVYMVDGLMANLGAITATIEQISQKATALQNILSSQRR